MRLSKST